MTRSCLFVLSYLFCFKTSTLTGLYFSAQLALRWASRSADLGTHCDPAACPACAIDRSARRQQLVEYARTFKMRAASRSAGLDSAASIASISLRACVPIAALAIFPIATHTPSPRPIAFPPQWGRRILQLDRHHRRRCASSLSGHNTALFCLARTCPSGNFGQATPRA
jgi:hypothetical protein